MTIEEAIRHCEDVADGITEQGKCPECAAEHRQLAEWLRELIELRAQLAPADPDRSQCAVCDNRITEPMFTPTTKINILGTEYTITLKKYDEDEYFKQAECNGYCSSSLKEIVLCEMSTYPNWENESQAVRDIQTKETLRHEIVHAFFNESGLECSSNSTDAWARNEEMVDWIALQGPKIYKVWQEAGAI